MQYADRDSKNIFLKNHIDMIKEQDSFKKKGRNGSIPIFSGVGSGWGEEYLKLLLFVIFAEQFNLLIIHLLNITLRHVESYFSHFTKESTETG